MNREKIIELATMLFWRYGIRSVTMSDIARDLGISKKTLYQFFQDKAEIVKLVTENQIQEDCKIHTTTAADAKNAIEEIVVITHHHDKMNENFHPSVLYDLKKYYPESWQLFLDFKEDFCVGCIVANLERGIKEGLYRTDIEPVILAKMRMEQVELMYNPIIFPPDKFNVGEVYWQITKHFINGILSAEGKEVFEKYTKEFQSQTQTQRP